LTDYRRFQEAALHLGDRDQRGTGAFGRGMGIVVPAPATLAPLAPHQPSSLARALRRRFSQAGPEIQVVASRPIVTVREIVARALGLASAQGRFRFRDILTRGADRQEVLTAFLAILVLVRRRVMEADQTIPFGEITLQSAAATLATAGQDDVSENPLDDRSA
jgi:chromatin segregation and condensation protein Rec8/ScpA/Scc1 (kleisin family)